PNFLQPSAPRGKGKAKRKGLGLRSGLGLRRGDEGEISAGHTNGRELDCRLRRYDRFGEKHRAPASAMPASLTAMTWEPEKRTSSSKSQIRELPFQESSRLSQPPCQDSRSRIERRDPTTTRHCFLPGSAIFASGSQLERVRQQVWLV